MTELVGILNLTPDSFSDGGLYDIPDRALDHAVQMFADGATLVDVGAESTRPGATPLTWIEEWRRLEPVLPELMRAFPGQISLDTRHHETAKKALALGEVIINDVTGMNSALMRDVILEHRARCVISHLAGTSVSLAHTGPLIDDSSIVVSALLGRAYDLVRRGLSRSRIILDPGIGFGKSPELNWQLLRFAPSVPEFPVMIGYSRKRFLGERRMELGPNLAAGRIAVGLGSAYLRVHDVAGHRPIVRQL